MRVVWIEDARRDLESIYLFLARVSQKAAVRVHNGIYDEAGKLSLSPFMGEAMGDFAPDHRTLFVKPNYKIVYRVCDEMVVIVAIWDCRKNPDKLRKTIN